MNRLTPPNLPLGQHFLRITMQYPVVLRFSDGFLERHERDLATLLVFILVLKDFKIIISYLRYFVT